MKTCKICGEEKPKSEFHRCRTCRDGRRYECKTCRAVINRDYRLRNLEKARSQSTRWRLANPERTKQILSDYYKTHREELLTYQKEYRAENPDKIKAYRRSDRCRQLRRQRELRLKIQTFEAYGGLICSRCGEERIDCLSIDHIAQDGFSRRKKGEPGGLGLYIKLRREDWPEGYRVLCHNCQRIVYWEWRRPQLKQDDTNLKARAVRVREKIACFEAYGGVRCAECGETRLDALTMDHTNNDGSQHRKRTGMWGARLYRALKSQGYPDQSRYQILCCNCNVVRFRETQRHAPFEPRYE